MSHGAPRTRPVDARGSLLVVNADIHTGVPTTAGASHLLATDGVVTAVGDERLLVHAGEVDEVLDAGGASVVPGFVDTHLHAGITGFGLLAEDLTGVRDPAIVARRVAEAARRQPPDRLVVLTGLDATRLPDGRLPALAEVERWAGGRAVYLMGVTGHECVITAAAAQRLDAALRAACSPPDGPVAPGHLTGAANIAAFTHLWQQFGDEVGLDPALRAAMHDALAGGVTTIHALESPERAAVLLDPETHWPVRVRSYVETFAVDLAVALGSPGVGGCGAAALDGDVDPHTAALLAPYTDDPTTCGQLAHDDVEVARFIAAADAAGLQVALHCVGSAAIEQALVAMSAVAARRPTERGEHRHRIEHFSLPEPGQATRAAAAGIAVGAQPAFNHLWPHHDGYPPLLGEDRASRVDPVRTLLDAGVRTGFGSDGPVTPRRPLLAIHAAVNHSNPAERIHRDAALAAHTSVAASLGFDEDHLGVLHPAYAADLVVLDRRLDDVADDELAEVGVAATVVAGCTAYRAG